MGAGEPHSVEMLFKIEGKYVIRVGLLPSQLPPAAQRTERPPIRTAQPLQLPEPINSWREMRSPRWAYAYLVRDSDLNITAPELAGVGSSTSVDSTGRRWRRFLSSVSRVDTHLSFEESSRGASTIETWPAAQALAQNKTIVVRVTTTVSTFWG